MRPRLLLTVIGPGMLVAATGVGAGDLATGALAGSKLGVAVAWAVLLGAGLKFVLNEGLARWQLSTGTTILEGAIARFGRPLRLIVLTYIIAWTYFTGAALMSACGVAAHAIAPISEASVDKVLYGLLHSATALVLIRLGGFPLFERVMRLCIGVMFVTVLATAIALRPDWQTLASGVLLPTIPNRTGDGLRWTVALAGGVGGTLTILCYGYWIREAGRTRPSDLTTCRWDLASGYLMTATFGICMLIIGSRISVEGRSAELLVVLADELRGPLGPVGRWTFLIGGWGAVFSSMLGVWQSVPYLFADACLYQPGQAGAQDPARYRRYYRSFLLMTATVPVAGMFGTFEQIQMLYAVFGALFIPLLAVGLLYFNGAGGLVDTQARNSVLTTGLLLVAVGLFAAFGYFELYRKLFGN
ncbi:Natural resistance-associated macrophage protein [Maioricimonas rarisocia]|uniref:Natural resistance-associated macrophage protein n=2 Tax=Maioricimonas rarisocia TaxID=2528026 RepID=A0A517ZDL5_9PLAN|nr:Natural resistance-associated macrophage protein [Maioricimonas rarisocia]